MKTAQENLKKAQEALANYNAVAPISGTVISCTLVPGETVESGRVALTIADTTVITVEAMVDSMNVSYVKPGMACNITAWGLSLIHIYDLHHENTVVIAGAGGEIFLANLKSSHLVNPPDRVWFVRAVRPCLTSVIIYLRKYKRKR